LTYAFTVDFHDLQILEKVRVLCIDFKGASNQIRFQLKATIAWALDLICYKAYFPLSLANFCQKYSHTVPRMYALFFHRLSIYERATDHKYIKDAAI
jgi:hypothetical protein